jgi:hypothetical protein
VIFWTESGSRYEIDPEDKMIRRLSKKTSPIGGAHLPDGEWLPYGSRSDLLIGRRLVLDLTNGRTLMTSRVDSP